MKNNDQVKLFTSITLYCLSLVIGIGTIGFAVVNFKFSLLSLIVFISFLLVYIQLPGTLIRRLLKVDLKFNISNSMLGFTLGLGSLFAQYYLFNMLYLAKLITVIGPIISMISVVYLVKGFKETRVSDFFKTVLNVNTAVMIFMSSLVFFICMLKLQFTYVSPEESAIINMGQDFAWHLGNINTLSKEGLAIDPRVYGITFKYHYFSDLILAICKYVTGITADRQLFSLSPILIAYLTVGSFYAFANEFVKRHRDRHLFVIFALFSSVVTFNILSNVDSYESVYFDHLFTNVNAVGFSMSSFLVGTIVVSQFIKNKQNKLDINFMATMAIVIFICTGMKGPFAAVLIAGLVCTAPLLFVKKDLRAKRFFRFTFITTVVFAIVYIVLLSSPAGGGGVSFSFTETISRSVLGTLNEGGLDSSLLLWSPLLIVVEFILLFGIFAILFVVAGLLVIGNIVGSKTLSSVHIMKWFMLVSTVIGCGGFFLLNQSGLSQVYFLFCVIPFIQLLAFTFTMLSKNKVLKLAVLGFMAFGVYINFNELVVDANQVMPRLVTIKESPIEWRLNSINADEYEALLWIREHTAEDALIISNRQSLISERMCEEPLDNRFFYYSAYADRHFFLEGFAYSGIDGEDLEVKKAVVEKVFYSQDTDKYDVLKENGIDYIIAAKNSEELEAIQETHIVKCFENNSVIIYEVQ